MSGKISMQPPLKFNMDRMLDPEFEYYQSFVPAD